MTAVQSGQQYRQLYYGAIALLALPTLLSWVFSPTALAQSTEALECLCESITDDDERFQCLLDQGTRLNRAKNLARQRGESENGGVSAIETEPSMHGPASESPYSIARAGGSIRYIFTFRVRPRATQNYTHESQVAINYAVEDDAWTVTTLYNQAIAPTTVSYSEEVEADTDVAATEDSTCAALVPETR